MQQLADNTKVAINALEECRGIRVIKPEGAMYVLIEILDKDCDDSQFTKELLEDQSGFVLPGTCFGAPQFFRIVTSPPREKLQEACERIKTFCAKKWGLLHLVEIFNMKSF